MDSTNGEQRNGTPVTLDLRTQGGCVELLRCRLPARLAAYPGARLFALHRTVRLPLLGRVSDAGNYRSAINHAPEDGVASHRPPQQLTESTRRSETNDPHAHWHTRSDVCKT